MSLALPTRPQPVPAQPVARVDAIVDAQTGTQTGPLFTREAFRRVAGETLRPGGLALTRRALELAALPPGSLAADIGCGPGATARLLAAAGHRVLALDLSEASLAAAQGPGVTAIRATAHQLPLASQGLDAVFCECVLSVVNATDADSADVDSADDDSADFGAADAELTDRGSADRVLAEAARALRPGGVLVVSDLYLRAAAGALPLPAAGAGGCLSGARGRAQLMAGLAAAGLEPFVFEDHSRLLAELAGRLIFAGLSPAELGAELGAGCSGEARPGYFLCLARKRAA